MNPGHQCCRACGYTLCEDDTFCVECGYETPMSHHRGRVKNEEDLWVSHLKEQKRLRSAMRKLDTAPSKQRSRASRWMWMWPVGLILGALVLMRELVYLVDR